MAMAYNLTENQEKLADWLERSNELFAKYNGKIFGTEWWPECFHNDNLDNLTILDWIHICNQLSRNGDVTIYPKEQRQLDDLEEYIEKHIYEPRCWDKGLGKHNLQPWFKNIMTIKDVMNRAVDNQPKNNFNSLYD